jgi:hypothetical protein
MYRKIILTMWCFIPINVQAISLADGAKITAASFWSKPGNAGLAFLLCAAYAYHSKLSTRYVGTFTVVGGVFYATALSQLYKVQKMLNAENPDIVICSCYNKDCFEALLGKPDTITVIKNRETRCWIRRSGKNISIKTVSGHTDINGIQYASGSCSHP